MKPALASAFFMVSPCSKIAPSPPEVPATVIVSKAESPLTVRYEPVMECAVIPFDAETCIGSVVRTGRLVILQEGQWFGGLGHSIQSRIMEEAFFALESAPLVIGALDTPVPFAPPLEDYTIPSTEHVVKALRQVAQG